MDLWRLWYQMALDSQRAAHRLQKENLRSCASRIYYSAYQAVTVVLLYRGVVPPPDREGWSHEATPDMIMDHWEPVVASKDDRKKYKELLKTLRNLRVSADYIGAEAITTEDVQKAMKAGNFLVKIVGDILPGE